MSLGVAVAELLEALGKDEAAKTVRWGEEDGPLLVDELARLEAEVERLDGEVERLEEKLADSAIGYLENLLCKRCAKKWEEHQR